MRYVGSKGKVINNFKHILEYNLNDKNIYIEPFVGGGNSIIEIDHFAKFGYDNNKYVIAFLNYLKRGKSLPDNISFEEYVEVKDYRSDFADWYVAFVGYCCSFGGKFFGGYARGKTAKGVDRNYADEQKRSIEKRYTVEKMKNCHFLTGDYTEIPFADNDVIYCDPPYAESQGYGDKFDTDEFWEWVRETSKRAYVYVSEFQAPNDFKPVWSKPRSCSLDLDTGGKVKTERLFVLRGGMADQKVDYKVAA